MLRSWLAVGWSRMASEGQLDSPPYGPLFSSWLTCFCLHIRARVPRERAENTLLLESWAPNWHENTSTSFCWPTWVIRPVQIQRVEKEISISSWKKLQSHTTKVIDPGNPFLQSIYQSSIPDLTIGGENQVFTFLGSVPDDAAKSLRDFLLEHYLSSSQTTFFLSLKHVLLFPVLGW